MATITYLDIDKTAPEVTIKGVKFTADKPVESNDPDLLDKFKNHPHFKVSGEYDKNKPATTTPPEEPAKPEAKQQPAPQTSTQPRK